MQNANRSGGDHALGFAEISSAQAAGFVFWHILGSRVLRLLLEEDGEFVGTSEGEAGVLELDVSEVDQPALVRIEIHAVLTVDDRIVRAGLDREGRGGGRDFRGLLLRGWYPARFHEFEGGVHQGGAGAELLGQLLVGGPVGSRSPGFHRFRVFMNRGQLLFGYVGWLCRDEKAGRDGQGQGGSGKWICIHGDGGWCEDPGEDGATQEALATFLKSVDKASALGKEAVVCDLNGFICVEAAFILIKKGVDQSHLSTGAAVGVVETDEDLATLDPLGIQQCHGFRLERADEVALRVIPWQKDSGENTAIWKKAYGGLLVGGSGFLRAQHRSSEDKDERAGSQKHMGPGDRTGLGKPYASLPSRQPELSGARRFFETPSALTMLIWSQRGVMIAV